MFQRNISSPASGLQSKPSRKPAEAGSKLSFKLQDTVAYLLHARTARSPKQLLLSNTSTQQYNNGVMQSVSKQQLGKHISAYQTMLCNAMMS
jgi:hypothetical protein